MKSTYKNKQLFEQSHPNWRFFLSLNFLKESLAYKKHLPHFHPGDAAGDN